MIKNIKEGHRVKRLVRNSRVKDFGILRGRVRERTSVRVVI